MQPDDIYELTWVGDPRIGPDGRIAYVVTRSDRETNGYLSTIWIHDGQRGRRLTDPNKKASSPRWSPDGASLAFLSDRDTEVKQLFVLPLDGGEALRLTDLEGGVEEFDWSPDSRALCFAARDHDPRAGIEKEKDQEPRRITRLWYKLDDEGWLVDRYKHLYLVDADGSGSPRALTKGEWHDGMPAWSPDGRKIAFVSARHDNWDRIPAQDVYVVEPENGEPERVTGTDGWCEYPAWSPDGREIAYLYTPDMLDDPHHGQIAVVTVDGGEPRLLTTELDRNCTPFPAVRAPAWDGSDIYFVLEDHGNAPLYRVEADANSAPAAVVEGERWVTGFDVDAGRVVYSATDVASLPELYDGDRRLTDVGAAFIERVEPLLPERFTATSRDGHEVEAWIIRPAGFDPNETYPVLLNIHGGPFTQYGNRFFDEFQVYGHAGYVVLYSNPRGSSGYSEAHGRAIRGPVGGIGPGLGTVDYDDVMAVVDTALERFAFCDGDRLGVMGGSYGGYMTTWICGHTDRFKAACSERAVNNWHSMMGSSDLGWIFQGYFGVPVWAATDEILKLSPITYAPNITTPMLILHSEQDHRCPIEQAEQLFAILRLLDRDVEFVRFPGEGHELTRSGSPLHRVRRFEILLDWFDRKLKN